MRRHRSSDHCGDTTWLRPATGSPRSLLRVVMDRSESLRVGVGQGRSSSELGGAEKHHLEQLRRLLLRPPAPPAALESPGILKSHRIRTHQPTQKNFGDSIAATRSTTRSTGMQHHREYQYRDSGTRRSTQNFSEEEEKKIFDDSIAATRPTTRLPGRQNYREYQYGDSGLTGQLRIFQKTEKKNSTTRWRRLDRRLDWPACKTIGNFNTGLGNCNRLLGLGIVSFIVLTIGGRTRNASRYANRCECR